MSVSLADVRYIARLARLKLSPQEEKSLQVQLSKIISYMRKLDELDTSGVKPLAHPLHLTNVLRDDIVQPGLSQEQALRNAPKRKGSFFSVPKVIRK